ncbi:hypothetical protein EV196_102593 [Mariniflexile fucanivorans]|uniref:Lipoprotein n=1 Tax=Mariniflexile fucanivorans TaxID=264023 RepID=A0A4R1RPC2_9FLAO|nr:DUF6146 family protein [Mariniflexile fucanivorans]TCL68029.1 hypothetical protein EV196_102593 [Mariniflexile fucanivorans]
MKTLASIVLTCFLIFSCSTTKNTTSQTDEKLENAKLSDTVSISNDELEYQIIIIEPGFNFWLASTAKPEGFYSQQYMETRNYQYVIEWNQRVLQPQRYDPNLYEMQIDYQPGIDYGYEVNYKLYNYFIYFQLTYKQRLGSFVPRI